MTETSIDIKTRGIRALKEALEESGDRLPCIVEIVSAQESASNEEHERISNIAKFVASVTSTCFAKAMCKHLGISLGEFSREVDSMIENVKEGK